MNKWIGTGRLVRDPELKFTNGTGTAVATFTLAVERKYVNQSTGQREADFINCVAWKGIAETIANYCKKGKRIGIVGRIQTRSYKAQDDSTRYVTEVVADEVEFIGSKKEQSNSNIDAPDGFEVDMSDCPF